MKLQVVTTAAAAGVAVLLLAVSAGAQEGAREKGGKGKAAAPSEEGFPVTNALVIGKCGTCHTKDEKGNLSRISWIRTTPEGWEQSIKRMARLNGLTITPAENKEILKYLGTYHGLAPEEAKPLMYMAEHRIQDEAVPNDAVRTTCMNCHALGRAFQWRRPKEDWTLLTNMHTALYPQAESAFRRNGGGGGGGRGGNAGGGPVLDQTLDFLAKNYGLQTPAWSAWRTRMRTPKLAGKWMVSAHVLGKGDYAGEMTIAPGAAEDEFTTAVTLQPVGGGTAIARTGAVIVYAGYSWRGRSKGTLPGNAAPDDLAREAREALWISADQNSAEGRWYWGEYQEFGFDVKLKRVTTEPLLISMDKKSLKVGSTAQKIRVIGANLPLQMTAADLDFGTGVKVTSLVSHTATEVVAQVDVAADAVSGKRDLLLKGAVLPNALAVYDKIDYVMVLPETSLARLGGSATDVHPKGYAQLEAVGYHRGQDGKIHTADDVELSMIDVNWSVEEFMMVFGDDDKEFIGSLSSTGLFSPAIDGPNPQRKFSRNNYGDVWVVATAKSETDKEGKPLQGKSYLVVTVPTYIRWDQPEVNP